MRLKQTFVVALLFTTSAAVPVTPKWHLTWSDEFNAPNGTQPDPKKWSFELGGNGWGNKELETYTARPSQRRAARRQPNHHRSKRGLHRRRRHRPQLHLRPHSHQRTLLPGLRPLRSPRPASPRQRHLASLLDTRRRHRHRPLAHLRRNRHPRKHRRTLNHPQHAARPRLQRLQSHHSPTHAPRRPGRQHRLPPLRHRVATQGHPLLRRQHPHRRAHSSRSTRRHQVGLRPSFLHHPQRRRWRWLARKPRFHHHLPAANARRLSSRLFPKPIEDSTERP